MKLFHKSLAAAALLSAALIPGLAHADDAPPAVKAFLDNLQHRSRHLLRHSDLLRHALPDYFKGEGARVDEGAGVDEGLLRHPGLLRRCLLRP